MSDDRREFIKKLAKGAVYVAPVVVTMTAPGDLMSLVQHGHSSQHKHHHGHGMGNLQAPATEPEFPPPPPGR